MTLKALVDQEEKPVVLIDGLSILFKEFHALAALKNNKGWGTGMAFGTLKQLMIIFTKFRLKNKDVILTWDRKPEWKFDLYPKYKEKRKKLELPPKLSIKNQIKMTEKMLDFLGIRQTWAEGEESDDVCATLSRYFVKKNKKVFVISSDHDLFQCLDENVTVLIPSSQGMQKFTEQMFKLKFGIPSSKYHLAQGLGGCPTDKVPGLRGISTETACKIVALNKWEDIIENKETISFPNKRSQTAFNKGFKEWERERDSQLVTLKTNVKIKKNFPDFDEKKLKKLFLFMEFKQYLYPDSFYRVCEIFGNK